MDEFERGELGWSTEIAELRSGANLSTATIELTYAGRPIATPAPVIVIDPAAAPTLVVGPTADAKRWESARDLDGPAPSEEATIRLVADHLGLDPADLSLASAIADVWVPVGAELRAGRSMRIETADEQGFAVLVDLTSMAVVEARPVPNSTHLECPTPTDLEAPAACVGLPSPDVAFGPRPLGGLDSSGGLVGEYVRVARGPQGSIAGVDVAALTDTFQQTDLRWGSDEAGVFGAAAANIYYWTTRLGDFLDGAGHDGIVRPPVATVVLPWSMGDNVAVAMYNHDIRHGVHGDGHSGADAQIVLHEYAHVLLARAAPRAWLSGDVGAAAYHEAAADVVAWTMTLPLDLDDPGCFSPYGSTRLSEPRGCLRRMDILPDSPPRNYYDQGNPWRVAMYRLLEEQLARAGESIDTCLPDTWCEVYSRALLFTTVESWPLLNRSRIGFGDAVEAFTIANDALGYFDADLVAAAFAAHPDLDARPRSTATVSVQHPDPARLRGTIDVIDAAGNVVCTVVSDAPMEASWVVDASICNVYLPADRNSVWRATVTSITDESTGGRILEFAIAGADPNTNAATLPRDAPIGGPSGTPRTVTIPANAPGESGVVRVVDTELASGIGIDATAGVALSVEIAGPRLSAFDLATGARIWSQPYSYGDTYGGIAAGFTLNSGSVYAVSTENPDGTGVLGIAAFDTATGERRWFTPVADPFILQDCGAGAVCIGRTRDRSRTRLSTADGAIIDELAAVGNELAIAPIDEDLVSMTEGSTPTIRRWDPATGAIAWSVTPSASTRASTSGGWNTSHRPEAGVYLVSIGPSSDLFDSTPGYTAALDQRTGDELWALESRLLMDGFPSNHVYLLTYRRGFGLNARATGEQIVRVDPRTGQVLATIDPGVDPLDLTFLFDTDGTSVWWRDGSGEPIGGHDMRLDRPLPAVAAVSWEVVRRPLVAISGEQRAVPPGFRAVWVGDGVTVETGTVPAWLGARDGGWFAYVSAEGGLVIGRAG